MRQAEPAIEGDAIGGRVLVLCEQHLDVAVERLLLAQLDAIFGRLQSERQRVMPRADGTGADVTAAWT